MKKIKILTGTLDCHFEENYQIALDNFFAGRPLFSGQKPATEIVDPRFPAGYIILEVPV